MSKFRKILGEEVMWTSTRIVSIIFFTSLFLMFLEFTLMRIYSFVAFPPVSFWVVGTSTMGFGLGAALAYFSRKYRIVTFSILFSIAICVTYLVVIKIPLPPGIEQIAFERILLHSIILSLPFMFGSFIFSQMFKIMQPSRVFFWSCLGSVIGTLLAFILIPLISAERSLFLTSILFPSLIFTVVRSKSMGIKHVIIIIVLLIFLSMVKLDIARELAKNYPSGYYHPVIFHLLHGGWNITYTKWDMLMRIDVMESNGSKLVIYDGKYQLPFDEKSSIIDGKIVSIDNLAPCFFRNYSSALIIGTGTGDDLEIVEENGVKEIHLVEINGAVVDLVKNTFDKHPYNRFKVEKMDGRKFIQKTDKKFDLIAFPYVDAPYFLTSNINYENYLFTVEGFKDFLTHLNENGTLCIVHDKERISNLYLFPLGTALRELKIDSNKNVVVVSDRTYSEDWGWLNRTALIVTKNGFHGDEIELIKYPKLVRDERRNVTILSFKDLGQWYDNQDALPVIDDRPYPDRTYYHIRDYEKNLLRFSVLVSLFLLVISYFLTKNYLLTSSSAFIGFGYMLVETAIIQKSIILFTMPPVAIATVLLSFLLFNGIGALLSDRLKNKWQLALLLILIPFYLWIFCNILDVLKNATFLHKNDYLMIATFILFLSPLGILLGLPFPYLLRKAHRKERPILYATDAAFATLGVSAGLLFSVLYGFTTSFMISALVYAVALALLIV